VPQAGNPLTVLLRIGLGVALTGAAVVWLQPSADRLVEAPATKAPAVTASAAPTAAAATAAATTAATVRPTPAAFQLTLSDAELTKAAASGFPQTVSGVTVSDPVVRVENDRVRLVAKAQVLFGTTQFEMIATPLVDSGKVSVRVDSATLAGLSLPSDTKAAIAQTVQGTITRLVPANVRVTGFVFAPGQLTVQGTQP
jgi:hypothetical protein